MTILFISFPSIAPQKGRIRERTIFKELNKDIKVIKFDQRLFKKGQCAYNYFFGLKSKPLIAWYNIHYFFSTLLKNKQEIGNYRL